MCPLSHKHQPRSTNGEIRNPDQSPQDFLVRGNFLKTPGGNDRAIQYRTTAGGCGVVQGQGKTVELYPGVETWFDQMHAYVKKRAADAGITVKHYLVSSGLTEIIEVIKREPVTITSRPQP